MMVKVPYLFMGGVEVVDLQYERRCAHKKKTMGNASAKDIHDAVDAGNLEKIEKTLEAKIELIDALSKELE